MSGYIKPINNEFSSMETNVGFQITKGLVAMGPAWLWAFVASGLSLIVGILIGMTI